MAARFEMTHFFMAGSQLVAPGPSSPAESCIWAMTRSPKPPPERQKQRETV
jgi:hypothetical protein